MEQKAKLGFGPQEIVSLVFGLIGAVYFVIGIFLLNAPEGTEDHLVGVIFFFLGAAFLLAATIVLFFALRKRKIANRLLREGRYVWGEISEILTNRSVHMNGRHPYIFLVRYQDSTGKIHLFRSRNLFRYTDRLMLGKRVKVYVEDDSFRNYYIDLQDILDTVIVH